MPTEVIVTAIPAGRKGTSLRVSAFINHRLTGGTKLGQFPDALKWASLNLKFVVKVDGVAKVHKVVSVKTPELWASMFNENTPVDGYVYKPVATRPLQTYSVRLMNVALAGLYGGAMQTNPGLPVNLAQLATNLAAFDPTSPAEDVPKTADQTVNLGNRQVKVPGKPYAVRMAEAGLARDKLVRSRYFPLIDSYRNTPGATAPADPMAYALEAKRFFEPWSTTPLKNIKPPAFDYHKALAALANHPEVMRALGLVVDFEIADSGLAPTGIVSVEITGVSPGTTVKSLATRYNQKLFHPVPKNPDEIVDGFMTVGTNRYLVTQIDVDGLTLKLLGLAGNVRNQVRSGTDEQVAALPALRSGGFGLARDNRAGDVKARLQRQDALASGPATPLNYDEIIRGYRVDVFDRGRWRSLCGRIGKYSAGSQGLEIKATSAEEFPEGWISMGVTSAPPATGDGPAPATGPMKLHESLFSWNGWSLVAERPGAAMDEQGVARRGQGNTLDPNFKVAMELVAAPGTLPTLRYGKSYRFRVRPVDLAGNSVPVSADVSGSQATPAQIYFRWDPVVAPGIYAKEDSFRPGESETHLVLRKFKTKAPETTTRREVLPPAGEQSLAETHGMFDEPVNSGKPSPAKYAIAKQYDKTLREVIAPGSDETVGIVLPNSLSAVPYLADPVSTGMTVGFLPLKYPGTTPALQVGTLAFPKAWPEMGSLTLELKAQPTGATQPITKSGSVMSVPLRPGEVVQAYLASSIKEDAVETFGPFQFLNAAQKSTLKPVARDGGLWMITPTRKITLVHATQVPEADAVIGDLEVRRAKGDTSVVIGRTFRPGTATNATGPGSATKLLTHAWSTSEVQFNATWADDLDLLEEPRRTTLQRQVKDLFAFKVSIPREEFIVPLLERHELGDTKYRRITYTLTGMSRFADYFPGEDTSRVSATTYAIDALSTAKPEAPIVEVIVPTFGWTRPNIVNGVSSARAGGGLRVYLRRPWFSSGNGERLAVVFPPAGVDPFTPDKGTEEFTLFGADPLFAAGDVNGIPTAANFVGGTAITSLNPPEPEYLGRLTNGVSYPVQFDEEKQMWYADIEIDLGSAYTPFVRLALARYQEKSLPGLSLSALVRTDFMQVTPDRTASVTYVSPTRIRAKVVGRSFTPGTEDGDVRRIIIGTVEERPFVRGTVTVADGDLGWRPVRVGGNVLEDVIPLEAPLVGLPLQPNRRGDVPLAEEEQDIRAAGQPQIRDAQVGRQVGGFVFRPTPEGPGEFTLPTARTERQYRLVIREYEIHRTDYIQPLDYNNEAEPAPNIPTVALSPRGGRLVYMDILPLS